jgi:hexosaminidase
MLARYSILLAFLPFMGNCQSSPNIQIIPQPVSVKAEEGVFTLKPDTRIFSYKDIQDWSAAADYLSACLSAATGYHIDHQVFVQQPNTSLGNAIYLISDPSVTHNEGYVLEVKRNVVLIKARTSIGAFYGVQTLKQLFPPEINQSQKSSPKKGWTAPCCSITDEPRFSYRGLHLDVGRHYFPVSFVKKYIDLLAMHKMNTFHWHLTEDQGWRIEIKRFPKLQEIAACRNETLIGHYSDTPQRFDGKKECAYYTQEEIKEVVEYAQKRFVTIIPEIEMPGHSQAALTAYPDLGCTGGPYEVAKLWGVFEDVYCAGNEQTFKFLDGVLEEVCALFPGTYVHIGGDECPKTRWEACPKCQKRMKDEKLKDAHELQSYFIRRAESMLAKHGKKLIGWDEILEGGLAPSATVMSWRGIDGGIAAAKSGHDAIMTPGSHLYLDHYQSDPSTEPLAIGGYLPIEKVYSYEPIPSELTAEEAKHILGAQGNVWTEYITSSEQAEYMAYPRACALSEVVWSPAKQRNWPEFSKRLVNHFSRLDAFGLNYSKALFDVSASFSNGKVSLKSYSEDAEIRYTTDGSEPGINSKKYSGSFPLLKSSNIKAKYFKKDKAMGNTLSVNYFIHKASGKPYTMPRTPDKYRGGEQYGLTNGVEGAIKSWNNWVGLVNHDIDPVIDLGASTNISKVSSQFVNSKVAWIYPPTEISVFVSDDGQNFKLVGNKTIDAAAMQGSTVEKVILETPGARGRYLKYVAKTFGVIPNGAPGAGEGAWLFVDEIVVE